MPNIKSQIKRDRQNKKRTVKNKVLKSKIKTAKNNLAEMVEAKKLEEAEAGLKALDKALDKAVKEPMAKDLHNPENKEKIQLLKKTINNLPSKLKETILLTEFSNMTYDEIGKSLGIPAGTIGSRRNKALNTIKENLKMIYGE